MFQLVASQLGMLLQALGWEATIPGIHDMRLLSLLGTKPQGDVGSDDPQTYTLFRAEDSKSWIIFTVVFVVLIIFDNLVLHRSKEVMSMKKASLLTFFWLCCAMGFDAYILVEYGTNDALDWLTGYLLEWLLSMDNLFVFHVVFELYACPDEFKHKPLFWGIVGAVVFRMLFFIIGEYALHAFFFMHLVFGVFLVYTGIQSAAVDDEDNDPTQNPLVVWISNHLPMIDRYDDEGRFFVKVAVDAEGRPVFHNNRLLQATASGGEDEVLSARSSGAPEVVAYKWKATMLVLVVCCLEAADILFAVDSVSAIVAQIDDLFLAYTAAVFAMLGLRAAFFIIDVLVKLFHLLKYGVGFILVFIGMKLIVSKVVHVNPAITCAILFTALFGCMGASMIIPPGALGQDDDVEAAKLAQTALADKLVKNVNSASLREAEDKAGSSSPTA